MTDNHFETIYFFDAMGGLHVTCNPDTEGAGAFGPRSFSRPANLREIGITQWWYETDYEACISGGRAIDDTCVAEGGFSVLVPRITHLSVQHYGDIFPVLRAAFSPFDSLDLENSSKYGTIPNFPHYDSEDRYPTLLHEVCARLEEWEAGESQAQKAYEVIGRLGEILTAYQGGDNPTEIEIRPANRHGLRLVTPTSKTRIYLDNDSVCMEFPRPTTHRAALVLEAIGKNLIEIYNNYPVQDLSITWEW